MPNPALWQLADAVQVTAIGALRGYKVTLVPMLIVIGVFWGAFVMRDPKGHAENLADLFRLYKEGKIRPHVSNRYPLERAAEAIKELSERRAKGKVVITI